MDIRLHPPNIVRGYTPYQYRILTTDIFPYVNIEPSKINKVEVVIVLVRIEDNKCYSRRYIIKKVNSNIIDLDGIKVKLGDKVYDIMHIVKGKSWMIDKEESYIRFIGEWTYE